MCIVVTLGLLNLVEGGVQAASVGPHLDADHLVKVGCFEVELVRPDFQCSSGF